MTIANGIKKSSDEEKLDNLLLMKKNIMAFHLHHY